MKPDGSEEWTLFGIGGEKIGTFTTSGPVVPSGSSTQTAWFVAVKVNVWFDGRLVTEGGTPVYSDRLGTNRAGGARFRPYGDEITSTTNDRVKFGTYTRDGFSGLDYADQRFYASSYGRFNTADPYRASAGGSDPGSWNRYAYVGGDPINYGDPRGLDKQDCSSGWMNNASSPGPCTSAQAGVDQIGSECGDFSFMAASYCGPYGNGSAGISFESEAKEPSPDKCHLEVRYSQIIIAGKPTGYNHTMLVGIDDTTNSSLGVIDGHAVLGILTPVVSANGIYNNANTSTAYVDSKSSSDMCDTWKQLTTAAPTYGGALYGAMFGSNSNTLTSFLWEVAGQNPIGPPPGPLSTPGWNGSFFWPLP